MVDYRKLVGMKGPGAETSRGFTIDLSPSWEAEKADPNFSLKVLEAKRGQTSEPVWEANDKRWTIPKPWGFAPYQLKFGGRCCYCGEPISPGALELYSAKLRAVAHRACRAGED